MKCGNALQSALNKRPQKLKKLGKDRAKILQTVSIRRNDKKAVSSVISTQEKKLKNLTKNSQIWFTSEQK